VAGTDDLNKLHAAKVESYSEVGGDEVVIQVPQNAGAPK
jgi:hypothetical protein